MVTNHSHFPFYTDCTLVQSTAKEDEARLHYSVNQIFGNILSSTVHMSLKF
jgi:hypothetical protein